MEVLGKVAGIERLADAALTGLTTVTNGSAVGLMLPGVKAGAPAANWTRQETTKLTEGRHTIAVPAGLQNVQLRADPIYMRKGDNPSFLWQHAGVEKREAGHMHEIGVVEKPQTIGLTVQDAAE